MDETGELRFAAFECSNVGVDRDRSTVDGLALADLDPAPVAPPLEVRPARVAVPLQPSRDPCVDVADRINDETAVDGRSDDLLKRHARHDRFFDAGVEELAVLTIAEDEPILRIVE